MQALFLSVAALAVVLFSLRAKKDLQPTLLGLALVGVVVFVIVTKKGEPFTTDSVEKQTGKILHLKERIDKDVTLNEQVLDDLEASVNKNTDDISTLQANTGVSKEAQKYA